MKRILTLTAVAAMVFTACSKEESTGTGDKQVRITPTIANPALTPASMSSGTRATDTDFELNDKVGLTITMTADGSAFVANKEMSFDGTDFKTEGFLWYEDVDATSTLFAYYPYQAGAAAPAEFSVKADQSGANYTASDLIVAVKTGVKPTLSATQMTFKHKMSRIVIGVTNESGFDITDIVIKGAVGTGVLDPATGDFTAKAGVEASDVIANTATAEKVYYALLVGWVDGDDLLPDGDGEVETPTVEWGGVKYKIVTLKDGRTWMAENLRYVPEGKTISSDPKDGNGVWYPCNLSKAADPSLTETAGLLYSYPVMLGMTGEMTGTNFDQYEGAQGICPDGWRIPTRDEWLKLAGVGSGSLSDPTSPYFDKTQSGGSIAALNKDGFNIAGCGYINAASATATPAYMATVSAADASAFGMGYFPSSTGYKVTYNTADDPESGIKNIQYYAGMITYNKSYNRMTIAYQGGYGAAPVRCIKNKE